MKGLKTKMMKIIVYCVKCKKMQAMKDATSFTTANHKKAVRGFCSVCGTKLIRFVKNRQIQTQIIKKRTKRMKRE